jgi:N-acetylmuramoyl-L-alanine amidase
MAKIAREIFLLFFTCSLLFGSTDYLKELQECDKAIVTANQDELLRVHHSLKSIYIHSIVTHDDVLKKEVLQRLVQSSKELNFDKEHYEKELETLLKVEKKSPIPKKEQKKEERTLVPKEEKTEPIKKVQNSSSSTSNLLQHLLLKEDMLYLEFDKALETKEIKYFVLKSKTSHKEVYDIKGQLPRKYDFKAPNGLKKLRLAQFDKDTIRVVLERENPLEKSSKKISNKQIRIYFNPSKEEKKVSNDVVKPKLYTQIKSQKTIVIDAGHGGKDGGAVGYKGKIEKVAVLSIALATGKELKKRGYKVYYTRAKDTFIQLRDRTKFANDKDADIFLSIHANAAAQKSQYLSHKGLETYFLSPARSQRSKNIAALENKSDIAEMDYFSKQTFLNVFNREKIIAANKLALDVQQGMLNSLRKSYKVTDGGVREAPFWVLVGAQMPSILIEVGYITNPTEAMRMFNVNFQHKIANGIADGIDSYFLKNN